MARLFRRLYRGAKRRIKQGLRDQRTSALYRAAFRQLAHQDYEQVTIAKIAAEAGVSVGAFYQRFSSKDLFLSFVILTRLDSARERLERDFKPERWQRSSARLVTHVIAEEIMRTFHGPAAGVTRAVLKRGHIDRKKLAPLLRYRAALADSAVALLAHRAKGVSNPDRAVRSAVQMAEATALDALLHDAGALRPGSQRMADTLSAMMLGMLGLAGSKYAGSQREDADEAGEDAMIDMPVEEIVAIELPDPVPRAPGSRRRKAAPDDRTAKLLATIRPKPASPQKEERPEPAVRRKRHRPTL